VFDASIHDLPAAGGWIVSFTGSVCGHHVHEDRAAVVICMTFVELGERAGEIVREDLVRDRDGVRALCIDAPGLIVDACDAAVCARNS
jgi:hypothetical protein